MLKRLKLMSLLSAGPAAIALCAAVPAAAQPPRTADNANG